MYEPYEHLYRERIFLSTSATRPCQTWVLIQNRETQDSNDAKVLQRHCEEDLNEERKIGHQGARCLFEWDEAPWENRYTRKKIASGTVHRNL